MIWRYSAKEPRVVPISTRPGTDATAATPARMRAACRAPAGLHVNRESRKLYLEFYSVSFTSPYIYPLYFNHDLDTIEITPIHLTFYPLCKVTDLAYADLLAGFGPTLSEINLITRLIIKNQNPFDAQILGYLHKPLFPFPLLRDFQVSGIGDAQTRKVCIVRVGDFGLGDLSYLRLVWTHAAGIGGWNWYYR